ncbi:MAG: Nif11-like leader peptide family natural product precursor [Propionivibrio sp.]|uniref:Nif11-like leader peptide family natural product n=1 Tax=Candidatus Propionivibrio dominans TaxID=2954373 RepID=A0A9D7FLL8_9RHOO|nr:Nif11-like leader peptide family natural product precursor [Candidatus Propionivibrio dominans]
MKGTITDFLELVSAKPELSRELIKLAARHGFEFSVDELFDNELQGVVGGTEMSQLDQLNIQNNIQKLASAEQMLANMSKTMNDSSMAIIHNMRG